MSDKIDFEALAKTLKMSAEAVREEFAGMTPEDVQIATALWRQAEAQRGVARRPDIEAARMRLRAEVTAIVALHNALPMPVRMLVLAEVIGLCLHADFPEGIEFEHAAPSLAPVFLSAMSRIFDAHRDPKPKNPDKLIEWREAWMRLADSSLKQFGSFAMSEETAALNAEAVARMRCVADGVSPSTPTNRYFEEPGGRLTDVRIGANDNDGEAK